jgi:hypothetical protein
MKQELEILAAEIERRVATTDGVAGLYPPHSALRTVLTGGRARAISTDGEGHVGLREEGGVLVVHLRFAGLATHAGPDLVRRVAAAVRGALGPRGSDAEVRAQLCAIVAGAELSGAADVVREN